MIKVRGVFPVGIILILLLGISSSFAQEYKRDIAEYKEKGSIDSGRGLPPPVFGQCPKENIFLTGDVP